MKKIFVLFFPFFQSAAFADLSQLANDYTIQCKSNTFDSDGNSSEVPLNEQWVIWLDPQKGKNEKTGTFYELSFTKKNRITGEAISEKTKQIAKMIVFKKSDKSDLPFKFSLPLGPDFNQTTGVFTSHTVSSLNEPFTMYGWTRLPSLVISTIEYRCEIEGVSN